MADTLSDALLQRTSAQQGQQPRSIGESLGSLVQSPVEDFIVTFMDLADRHGILDESFQPSTVQDQADVAEAPDVRQFLSRDEMELLLGKFERMPVEIQQQLLQALKQENPRAYSRIVAGFRLLRGSEQAAALGV